MQNHLAVIRKSRRLSQVQLASLLYLPQGRISEWETGRRVPSLEYALRIARFLHCRVEDIFLLDE